MATKKSAPKTAAKKPARPEKKAATKARPADTKKAAAKKPDARAGEAAAKAKDAAKKKAAAPVAAKNAKPAKAARPAPASAKETKTTTPPPTSRRGAPAPPAPAAPARKRTGPPRTVAVTVGSELGSKLGTKWACFRCGSRFYDLHKPEPICPKCGADQRERPKVTASSTPTPPPAKKAPRPMAPLLDDEDDGTVRYDEEFDLGVRTDIDEAEEDLFPTGETEEEDVFGGPEEE
jgi:ribosomal protein L37E